MSAEFRKENGVWIGFERNQLVISVIRDVASVEYKLTVLRVGRSSVWAKHGHDRFFQRHGRDIPSTLRSRTWASLLDALGAAASLQSTLSRRKRYANTAVCVGAYPQDRVRTFESALQAVTERIHQ